MAARVLDLGRLPPRGLQYRSGHVSTIGSVHHLVQDVQLSLARTVKVTIEGFIITIFAMAPAKNSLELPLFRPKPVLLVTNNS